MMSTDVICFTCITVYTKICSNLKLTVKIFTRTFFILYFSISLFYINDMHRKRRSICNIFEKMVKWGICLLTAILNNNQNCFRFTIGRKQQGKTEKILKTAHIICVISYLFQKRKKQSVMTTISSAFLSVFLLLHMGCIKRTDQRQQFFITNSNPNNQQHVITISKRSGIHCRSVCGKCEQILGQSWSLRCQHDCLHGGVPFLVCLKVTLYRDL